MNIGLAFRLGKCCLAPRLGALALATGSHGRCHAALQFQSISAERSFLRCHASASGPKGAWPNGKKKRRLDDVCRDLVPEYSMNVIRSFILSGKVFVDEQKVTKAGHQVGVAAAVDVRAEVPKWVCRAGAKLEKALDSFGVDVAGWVALDAGLSTGGFTDCLLQRGATQVFGVDVGYGQVAEKIRVDPRVTVMERTNLRTLDPTRITAPVDIVTLDVSFISVIKVMPAVLEVMKPSAVLIVLIKPQFEAGLEHISKGGLVKDPAVHESVIADVTAAMKAFGLDRHGLIESPIKGAQSGNTEFLAMYKREQTVQATAPDGPAAPMQDGNPA